MAKYISEAKDKVTIQIEYPRPLFMFPDISGEQGNPREYFKLATAQLRKFGFYRESKELESLGFEPYATHFNNIARYLDYTNSQMESEDDEYIYLKIKKSDGSVEQPRCFSRVVPSHVQELIDEEHDFSLTNCYGRNHLHYTTELPAVKLLVEANKNNQWFDIFHLDCFNSTLLHGKRSFPVFGYLLEEMYNESPELTERFLHGTNLFGQNAFGEFLKACDVMFSFKNGEPKVEDLNGLGHVLKTLGKIDPEKRDHFITLFDVVEKKNPAFKKADYKAFILQAILEGELDVNNNAVKRKIKI
jgi:hypothetical protein